MEPNWLSRASDGVAIARGNKHLGLWVPAFAETTSRA